MYKPFVGISLISLTLVSCSLTGRVTVPVVPFAINGFTAPESVLYDKLDDLYLVGNMGALTSNTDDDGSISQVLPDGTIQEKTFISGGANGVTLNAPKGMAIVGDTLYVADINVLRMFNRKTGAPTGNVNITGSSFLNDVAAAPDGSVYISDTGFGATFAPDGNDAIYKVSPGGSVSKIASGPQLKLPNGLAVLPNGKVQVVAFGSNEIYTVTDAGVIGDRKSLPGGQLDGVEIFNGGLLITSMQAKAVYFVDSAGAVSTLAGNLTGPADLGLDTKRNRALIPLTSQNMVQVITAK